VSDKVKTATRSFVVTEAHKSVGNPHGKDASKSINKKELTMAIKVRGTRI